MRIVGGRLRGRRLVAPVGSETRPTADRARQALFDMLMHSPWAAGALPGARVLDVFAGTGAMGLEAISRGAAEACFIENDRAALAALRTNIAACDLGDRAQVVAADAARPPKGSPCGLAFLDPPYGRGLVRAALDALGRAGWIAPDALIIAEVGVAETPPMPTELLLDRSFGAARLCAWRSPIV